MTVSEPGRGGRMRGPRGLFCSSEILHAPRSERAGRADEKRHQGHESISKNFRRTPAFNRKGPQDGTDKTSTPHEIHLSREITEKHEDAITNARGKLSMDFILKKEARRRGHFAWSSVSHRGWWGWRRRWGGLRSPGVSSQTPRGPAARPHANRFLGASVPRPPERDPDTRSQVCPS